MPKSFPFPIDDKLTGIALAYKNDNYIADEVLDKGRERANEIANRKYDLVRRAVGFGR